MKEEDYDEALRLANKSKWGQTPCFEPQQNEKERKRGTNERICAHRDFSQERVVSWPPPLLSLQFFLSGKMETDTASCFLSASLSLALAVVACGIGNPLAYEIQKLLVEKIQLGRIPLHYESITLTCITLTNLLTSRTLRARLPRPRGRFQLGVQHLVVGQFVRGRRRRIIQRVERGQRGRERDLVGEDGFTKEEARGPRQWRTLPRGRGSGGSRGPIQAKAAGDVKAGAHHSQVQAHVGSCSAEATVPV